jgi:hypothetical protein
MKGKQELQSLLMAGVGPRVLGAAVLATLLGFAVVWALQ